MKDTLIIIPTYNEADNIALLLRKIFSIYLKCHVLVVDDNSPDDTSLEVLSVQKEFSSRLFLLNRSSKNGLGKAYIEGFNWGLKRTYKYFFEMDADFSHDPKSVSYTHLRAHET